MSDTPAESPHWPPSAPGPDGEQVVADLRQQLESAKARMQDYREGFEAAGRLPTDSDRPSEAGS
jgi:hypothetical protein